MDMNNEKRWFANIPNALSILRALIAFAIGVLLFVPHSLLFAQVLYSVGLVSDKLDGTLARLLGVESDLGKRLESVVDPLFGATSAFYIALKLDYPVMLFWYGITLLVIVTLGRILFSFKYKQLFYEKSPLTRYSVGVTYVVLIFFMFQLPGRQLLIWPITFLGTIVSVNYLRMIIQSALNHGVQNAGDQE